MRIENCRIIRKVVDFPLSGCAQSKVPTTIIRHSCASMLIIDQEHLLRGISHAFDRKSAVLNKGSISRPCPAYYWPRTFDKRYRTPLDRNPQPLTKAYYPVPTLPYLNRFPDK